MKIVFRDESSETGYTTWEEVKARWDAEDAKRNFRNWLNNKFPKGYAGYNAYYILIHPWEILREWKFQIKWAWQRVFRGWDDRATWNIDGYLSKLIPQLIKFLKEAGKGIPAPMFADLPCDENYHYSEESEKTAQERWYSILDGIIEGFEEYSAYEGIEHISEEYKKEKLEKAFDLLKEHFGGLWW